MWKLSNIFIPLLLFASCHKQPKFIFQPHIKEYLNIFISENKELNPKNNIIFISCVFYEDEQLNLSFSADLIQNIDQQRVKNNNLFLTYYKDYMIFIYDEANKIINKKYRLPCDLNKILPKEVVPIQYENVCWDLIIKNDKIKNINLQFCECNFNIINNKLNLIKIPNNWCEK